MVGCQPGIRRVVELLHRWVWGPWALILLMGTGLWFTLAGRFFQIRGMRCWWRCTMGKVLHSEQTRTPKSGITPFQAMCTALAATIGTGNIAGVATAIAAGGPGAVFWMMIAALLGSMTCFAEQVLGHLYRWRDGSGRWHGGAMAYLERGLHSPFLARLYALLCVCSTLGMGDLVQVHSIASLVQQNSRASPVAVGAVLAALATLVILGGVQRIAGVTQTLVPVMGLGYVCMALAVVAAHARQIPAALGLVVRSAFSPRAGVGGAAGYTVACALRTGVARGVFSNEAGLGTSVLAHVETSETDPAAQGMWGIFQVFADTLIVCTLTALAILTSGVYDTSVYGQALGTAAFSALSNGAALTASAFGTVFGAWGPRLIGLELGLFAFSTVLASAYFGSTCAEYLLGRRAVPVYQVVFLVLMVVGSALQLELVWQLSDVFNGLMLLPNLVGVMALSRPVRQQLRRARNDLE